MTATDSFAKLIEAKLVQQTLKTNPNDINSLVKLATMIKDDSELKRSVLDRILKLEPANKAAREMMLELDRTQMFSGSTQSASTVSLVQSPGNPSVPSVHPRLEKPLVVRYSIIHQILVYPAVASFLLPMIFMIPSMDVNAIPGFIVFFLLLLIPVWFVSAVAQVSNTGIKLTRMFGLYRCEIEWKDIRSVTPNPIGVGMKLTTEEGKAIRLSSQLLGYGRIVKILQGMRPDLFRLDGSKTFKKGFWGKYGWFFIIIPITLLVPGAIMAPPFIFGIILASITYLIWKSVLHAPHTIAVKENRFFAQSFRDKLELTAQQIKDISVITVRSRRGVANNLLQVTYNDKDQLTFTGFPEGVEIMYGFLQNWWKQYRIT